MTGIPTTTFDYFNLAEIPTFTLCNPNKEPLYTLGTISERTYSAKFNTLSEISFRADKTVNGIEMPYYNYLAGKRLVLVEGIGYFTITEISEDNDGVVEYKEITCQSLEVELSSKRFVVYISGDGVIVPAVIDEDGTVLSGSYIANVPVPVELDALIRDLETYIPHWSFPDIYPMTPPEGGQGITIMTPVPPSLQQKFRSFDITDKTLYDLLMTDVEESYGCIFDFDTFNNYIYIYDAAETIGETDIYISHDNLIESIKVEEVTDELSTCLYVMGGNSLGINYVNPLGNNYMYNFDYFKNTNWMSQSLIDDLDEWDALFISASPAYAALVEDMFFCYGKLSEYETLLIAVSGSIAYLNTAITEAEKAGLPTAELEARLAEAENKKLIYERTIDAYTIRLNSNLSIMGNMSDELSFENRYIFPLNDFLELQPFIIQSSYVNENIIQTESMTSASLLIQSYTLYFQALEVLDKVSSPRYTFEIDSVNFMNIQSFQKFRDQIMLGKTITIEIREDVSASPILLEMDMGFDDPTDFKLVFGNRLRIDDDAFKYGDLMNRAINAGNFNRVYSQQLNDFSRNYQGNVDNLLTGVTVHSDIGFNEGVYINQGNSINLVTPSLLWNGYPIGTGAGGTGLTEIKITLFSGGVSVAMYEPTPIGLSLAIAASLAGDVIFLPDVEITGDFSIPAGVNLVGVSSRESIIHGEIIIEPLSLLENITVINQQDSALGISAVIVKETVDSVESSKIKGCELYAYQCGSGSAVAVYIPDPTVVVAVENSTIIADSNSGTAYAFAANTSAYCNVYHSGYYAKTEIFYNLP
jgi:hypothetical protein